MTKNFNSYTILRPLIIYFAANIILIFALYLRLTNQISHMQWIDDSARDITIAKLIVQTNSFSTVRPFSAGLSALQNSTLYYDSMGVLFKITQGLPLFLFFYTLIQTSSIVFAYAIGKHVGNTWVGLACMMVLASNLHLINAHQSVYQRNILPLAGLLITYIAIVTIKKNNLHTAFILLTTVVTTFLFHNAIITFFIPASIVFLFIFFRSKTKKKFFYAAIFVLVSFLSWIYLTKTNVVNVLQTIGQESQQTFPRIPINIAIKEYSYSIFRTDNSEMLGYFLLCFYFITLGIGILKKNKTLIVFLLFTGNLIIFWIISTIFLHGKYSEHWFQLAYYPLWAMIPIIAGYHLFSLFGKKILYFFYILVLYLVLYNAYSTLKIITNNQISIKRVFSTQNEYLESQKLVEKIYSDYKLVSGEPDQYPLITDSSDFAKTGWFSPAFLYFALDNKPDIVNLSDQFDNNLNYNYSKDVKIFYLICHNFYDENDYKANNTTELIEKKCISKTFTNELNEGLLVRYPQLEWVKDGYNLHRIEEANTSPIKVNVYRVTSNDYN